VTRTIDGTTYSLRLTDTAGQEEYRGLWSQANLKCDAFLLVYDITQASSLEALEYFTQMIDMEREDRLEQNEILPVCFVAGNKCDLQGNRQIAAKDGMDWSRKHNFGFMETSAREMVNIEETFARKWTAEECYVVILLLTCKQSSSVVSSKRGKMLPLAFPKRCQLPKVLPTPPHDLTTRRMRLLPTHRRKNSRRRRRKNAGTRPSSAGERILRLECTIFSGSIWNY
jgi:small GTP-binding protein